MTHDLSLLCHCYSPSVKLTIHTADGTLLPVTTIGSVSHQMLSSSHVLCVPQISINLISVSQLASSGYIVAFSSTGCFVQDSRTRKQIGTGHRSGGLYYLRSLHLPLFRSSSGAYVSYSSSSPFSLWHS